jgi:hypothetical protein
MNEQIGKISRGIDIWLRQEVTESGEGRNQSLDSYPDMRQSYMAGEDGYTLDVAKAAGHYGRFKLALGNLDESELQPFSDFYKFAVGKVIHHALMFVSGGFRTQAFLEASSQEEYNQNRFGRLNDYNGAIGINLDDHVGEGLKEIDALATMQGLKALSHAKNDEIYNQHRSIYAWFASHPEKHAAALGHDSDPVQAALAQQRLGLAIAVSHIAFFGNRIEGGFAQVPFLEPKGISDVSRQPIYPLAA